MFEIPGSDIGIILYSSFKCVYSLLKMSSFIITQNAVSVHVTEEAVLGTGLPLYIHSTQVRNFLIIIFSRRIYISVFLSKGATNDGQIAAEDEEIGQAQAGRG